jgi:hypothetical protein
MPHFLFKTHVHNIHKIWQLLFPSDSFAKNRPANQLNDLILFYCYPPDIICETKGPDYRVDFVIFHQYQYYNNAHLYHLLFACRYN